MFSTGWLNEVHSLCGDEDVEVWCYVIVTLLNGNLCRTVVRLDMLYGSKCRPTKYTMNLEEMRMFKCGKTTKDLARMRKANASLKFHY